MNSLSNNAGLNPALDFKMNVGLVHKITNKIMSRAGSMRTCYEEDDIFQELSIVWLECVSKFDEGKGVKFSTYFVKAAYNRANKLLRKEGNAPLNSQQLAKDEDGEDADLFQITDFGSLVDYTERAEILEREIETVSDQAKLVIDWMITPPKELLEYSNDIARQRASNSSNGKKKSARLDMAETLSFVRVVVGMNTNEMYSTRAEVIKFIDRLGEQ